jgi:hypothetical protein
VHIRHGFGRIAAGAIMVLSLVAFGVAVPAGALSTKAQRIASLALANRGRHACARNSLGGRGYGSSCTGNGGRPEYWCADFAKWVWQNAGVKDIAALTPAAGSFYSYGLRYGTLTGTPSVGDAAVFNYYGGGVAEHVAIVTAVNPDGTIETTSGDWGGNGGTEAAFASTSTVTVNDPAYVGAVGEVPPEMGMVLSAFVRPVGVAVTPLEGGTEVTAGTTLQAGDTISSPNGLYTLGLSSGGALVEQMGSRLVWTSGTAALPGDQAVMETDGNLVLYSPTGQPLWQTGTPTNTGGSFWLKDNGQIAIESPGGATLWLRTPPVNALQSGGMLRAGQKLVVADGLYELNMQSDGNLVEYSSGRVLWASKTAHHAGAHVVMTDNGHLVVVTTAGKVLKVFNTANLTSGVAQLVYSGALVIQQAGVVHWSNGV